MVMPSEYCFQSISIDEKNNYRHKIGCKPKTVTININDNIKLIWRLQYYNSKNVLVSGATVRIMSVLQIHTPGGALTDSCNQQDHSCHAKLFRPFDTLKGFM